MHLHTYFRRQRTNYYCGPAIIQMVLAKAGVRITQRQAALEARTDKVSGRSTGAEVGTSLRGLLSALKSFGLRAVAAQKKKVTDIARAVAEGKTVIVCYTERHYNWGHYSLVERVTRRSITLIDPAERGGRVSMPLAEFKKRWRDPLHTKSDRWAAFVTAAEPRRRLSKVHPKSRRRPQTR